MTVSYYPSIATVRQGALIGLLLRWKGSLYKLVLPELVLFLILYSLVSCVYRFALNQDQRAYFVNLCLYLDRYTNQSGLTFCLGFFVSVVMTRWWETFKTVPWLYTPAYVFRQMIVGSETECCQVRQRLVRYLLLSWIFLTRKVSGQIMRRFKPSSKLLRDASLEEKLAILNEDPFIGRFCNVLITDDEIESIMRFAKRVYPDTYDSYQPDHYVPLAWAADVVRSARKRKLIQSEFHEQHILQTLENFRAQLGMIGFMDQFNIPLVYTQVVCWSMHVYFAFSLFAEQFHGSESNAAINGDTSHLIDLYIPFPALFQLAFYFGWIKVAEVCLNPFGDDDDDFPMWNILNMNVETAFKMISILELNPECDSRSPPPSGNAQVFNSNSGYPNSHVPMTRRISQSSQFEAFADQNAADRFRDEYERLARKYERPTYLGSAIQSQMDREAATATSGVNNLALPSDFGGSRLLIHEAGRALRKMSSVLRGAPQSSTPRHESHSNLNEDYNPLAPFISVKSDRAMSVSDPHDSHSVVIGATDDNCGTETPGSPSSVRNHINTRLVFGAASTHHVSNRVHDAFGADGDHEDQSPTHSDGSITELHIAVPTKRQVQQHHEDCAGHLAIIREESGVSPVGSCCSDDIFRGAEAPCNSRSAQDFTKIRKIGTHSYAPAETLEVQEVKHNEQKTVGASE